MMKNRFSIIAIVIAFLSCTNSPNDQTTLDKETLSDNIPTLDELSGDWVSYDTVDMEPSIRNFRGQALVNRDLTSISWLASAPYSSGYHSGAMRINGITPKVESFRWQPYQTLRKATVDNIELMSTTRMLIEKNVVIWEVEILNAGSVSRKLEVTQDMIGFISKYDKEEWQWWYPYPTMKGKVTKRDEETENSRKYIGEGITSITSQATELVDGKPVTKELMMTWPSEEEILMSDKYATENINDQLLISDSETDALIGFSIITKPTALTTYGSGGTAKWKVELAPSEKKIIRYAMTFGDDQQKILSDLTALSGQFNETWTSVKTEWENRWQEIFKPNNTLLSGAFPILETDDEKAKKVYYTGPLTMLYLMHTNLPQHKKVFLTGGPRWGASITFYWDITEWATLWAVVDPDMMKEHLSSWIKIDPSKYYGQDNFGGSGVGNGYSANYWALFQMIRAYITVSKDVDFLQTQIDGKTVMEHLDHYATNWKRISIHGQEGSEEDIYKLADFGDDEWNLLECVPTYKHIVPSFNAGYIWMMRETAAFYTLMGNNNKAELLNKEASEMIERLLQLYAGDGVWYSLYPNGKKVEVRHCLDFMFLGRYLPNDIPEDIKSDMMDFAYRELITDNWMRAQSLLDVAAKNSDRADHGPLGAFDGWPAGTMDALDQLGFPEKAMKFYHAIEPVTNEGIWAQAHELWGDNKRNKNADVRIAQRGWHNRESSAGIAMSQVMLKNFFGFYPTVDGTALKKNKPLDFEGKLHHVKYGDEYYRLEAVNGEVSMVKETEQTP